MISEQEAIDTVCNTLVGFIFKKFPNISLTDLNIFIKDITPRIKDQIKTGNQTIIFSDNGPSGALVAPFRKMSMFKNDPNKADATTSLTFPLKMLFKIDLNKNHIIFSKNLSNEKLHVSNEYKNIMIQNYEERFNEAKSALSEQELKDLEQKYNRLLEQVNKIILPTDKKDEQKLKLKKILTKLKLEDANGISVDSILDGETEFYARMITTNNKKREKERNAKYMAELDRAKSIEELDAIDKKYKSYPPITIDEFLVSDYKVYAKLKKELNVENKIEL